MYLFSPPKPAAVDITSPLEPDSFQLFSPLNNLIAVTSHIEDILTPRLHQAPLCNIAGLMLFRFILHTHPYPFFLSNKVLEAECHHCLNLLTCSDCIFFGVFTVLYVENNTDFFELFHCLTVSALCSLMWLPWKTERDRMFLKCTTVHLVVLWALPGMATVAFGQPLGLST